MADDWHGTTQRAVNFNISAPIWNEECQDNLDALKSAVMGDAQATAEVIHQHKTGTFAALPTAGKPGRLYVPSDILPAAMMIDDGTNWRGSAVIHETFNRANSTTLGNANSGHPWTEQIGNLEIYGNALRVVSSAAASIGTVDPKILLDDAYLVAEINLYTAATDADISAGIVLRFVDTSNYLYVRYVGGTTDQLQIRKVVAAAETGLAFVGHISAEGAPYTMRAIMAGGYVRAELLKRGGTGGDPVTTVDYSVLANTRTPFLGATELGVYIAHDVADQIGAFVADIRG